MRNAPLALVALGLVGLGYAGSSYVTRMLKLAREAARPVPQVERGSPEWARAQAGKAERRRAQARSAAEFQRREDAVVPLDLTRAGTPKPARGRIARLFTDASASVQGDTLVLVVRGPARQMHWRLALPPPTDLGHISFSYRAEGAIDPDVILLAPSAKDPRRLGAHEGLLAGLLEADGRWHHASASLAMPAQARSATRLLVGLGSTGDAARLALKGIVFTGKPWRWLPQDLIPHRVRSAAWPEGRDGWITLPPPVGEGGRGGLLALREWFASPNVVISGVPFTVPRAAQSARISWARHAKEKIAVPLPGNTREVYLLTGVDPKTTFGWLEPDRTEGQRRVAGRQWVTTLDPGKADRITAPEDLLFEVRYARGPAEFVMPFSPGYGVWGLRRGLAVHVVHPSAGRQPKMLVLHNWSDLRLQEVALLGVTARVGAPLAAKPPGAPQRYTEAQVTAWLRAREAEQRLRMQRTLGAPGMGGGGPVPGGP